MKSILTNNLPNDVILDSMPGMSYIFTKQGHLTAWNKRSMEVYEYSADEMQNKYVLDFVEESEREKILNAFRNVFVSDYLQVETIVVTKSGKKIPVLATGTHAIIDGEDYLIGINVDISELNSARRKIVEQISEISRLNELLKAENFYLNDQIRQNSFQYEIVGDSESLKYVFFKVKQVAPTDAAVLIEGETGTGKELIARAIHRESKRKDKPFIKVNCASIPESLFESELFGHEKGAFTSAVEKHIGRFEIANGGTIFLDEVGELPLSIQPKLLHILQQGEFERIGNSKTIKTDVRIISATNKVLEDEINKGRFRADLFYRLNVFPISITPLRERKSDIPLLVEYYTNIYSKKFNIPIDAISNGSMQLLINHPWPGNVRELENVIERAIITSNNGVLNFDIIPKGHNISDELLPLEEHEKRIILKALEKTYWKISGNFGAASILKLNPETLRSKMRKLGIKRKAE